MPLLRTAAAAAYLGVSPQTLHAWRKRGIGPAYVQLPYAYRRDHTRWDDKRHGMIGYPTHELNEFVERCKVRAGRLPRPHAGRLPGGEKSEAEAVRELGNAETKRVGELESHIGIPIYKLVQVAKGSGSDDAGWAHPRPRAPSADR